MTKGEITVPGVLRRFDPEEGAAGPGKNGVLPLVFDSPHSGRHYPADFGAAAPASLLRRSEDFAVERLFAAAPRHGATLIAADFPRCYIDPNRPLADLDPLLLDRPWPSPPPREGRSRDGVGLVWRLVGPGQPIYSRRLSHEEIQRRIESYYQPYHREVADTLDRLQARFGAAWFVDCHSMPSQGLPPSQGGQGSQPVALADFVIGDQDGATANPSFRAVAVETLRAMGYRVAVNRPYKGDELIRRHGRPAQGREALQIEVNRRLYMDEARIEAGSGFAELERAIGQLIAALAAYVRAEIGGEIRG